MQVLPKLRALVLLDTPLTENSDYRLEVLISVRRLERLDKDEYLEEERSEAEQIYEERRAKEQEEAAAAVSAAINDDIIQTEHEKIAEDGAGENKNENEE